MLCNQFILFIFVILGFNTLNSNCARILSVYSTFSRSHFIVAEALLKQLARQGHNVTVVSKYPQSRPLQNYRDVPLLYDDPMYEILMKDYVKYSGDATFFMKSMPVLFELGLNYTRAIFEIPEFQKIWNEEEFDLVIVEGIFGDPLLGFAAHFNCPSVVLNSFEPQKPLNDLVGNPTPFSYVSCFLLPNTFPMSFINRVLNFVAHLIIPVSFIFTNRGMQEIYKTNFPSPQYPTLDEMRKNVSLALVNYHFTQGSPRPSVPAVVEVGGLQVKEIPEPLPTDLKEWIDGADHGVIYVSFGSNIKSKDLPTQKLQHIVNTFSNFEERFIWKFENETIARLPSNAKVWKWLPQDDLLAHPKLKLFVTHGGLGSVLEAKVRGVPIVGVPIFADQMSNLKTAENEGWCVSLHYNDLTTETFTLTMKEAITNTKYRSTAQYLSKLFLDRPQSAMTTAIFWIEYVLRHRGAKHMQANSVHLDFLQLYSIDVMGFLLLIVVTLILVLFYFVKYVFRKLFGSKLKKKKSE